MDQGDSDARETVLPPFGSGWSAPPVAGSLRTRRAAQPRRGFSANLCRFALISEVLSERRAAPRVKRAAPPG
ncbi:hypothetical protein Hhal_0903 [Halorhodospira halophila SL1]|uniref:Uncharacterized protein n=1 Tax=Halorhodospira halophila (strain DSM 244 / SL1) TaxID=349124 RepID=A1WVG7_HALHL|nr:hypothetical protein Hhal_0903 [Halorhodospira halophila SL1]